ncbi:MAG: glycosyltransferase family 2 protein [Candidatus Jordarchaeum sp.]|uniref:glycosyltransferase family 2 protein n=1 Tax=Candidatus Jordarchaeum sp. TaxID=2823881 RepID=UPI00404B6BA2
MDMSVIVLTFNRKDDVLDCVESVIHQDFEDDYEIIVIDNWSEDGTFEELKSKFSDFSSVKIVRPSKRIGIAAARNYGLQLANGRLVAFIDDDCIATRSWLNETKSAFKDESVGCVGGRISLLTVGIEKPSWIGKDIYGILGITSWGEKNKDIYFPIGGNLAIRKDLALKIGGFKEQLGPRGVKVFGEEISISNRVRGSGYRVVYAPRAEVLHKIWKERIDLEDLIKRAYMISVGDYYLYGRSLSKIVINMGILLASLYGYLVFWRSNLLCHFFYAAGYLVPALFRKEPLKMLENMTKIWRTTIRRK